MLNTMHREEDIQYIENESTARPDWSPAPVQETELPREMVLHALPEMEEHSLPLRKLMAYYRCAMMEVETKFRVLDTEFSLQHDRNPIAAIKTRLKKMSSITEKLVRYGFPLTVDSIEQNLSDIAGVRVVCSFPQDVSNLAEAFLAQDDVTLVTRKDYIANPKPNGYRSLHLIVEVPIFLEKEKRTMRVEIQLRTIAMDCWATLEHQLKYKKEVENAELLIEELRQCADLSAELDDRMDAIRKKAKQ